MEDNDTSREWRGFPVDGSSGHGAGKVDNRGIQSCMQGLSGSLVCSKEKLLGNSLQQFRKVHQSDFNFSNS